MVHVFNVAAFFIVLRAVLEACLVCGIIIAYLYKTGNAHLLPWVWAAVILGAALSFLVGLALTVVVYKKALGALDGRPEHIFEASGFLIAAALLTATILWTARTRPKTRDNIENILHRMLTRKPGSSDTWAVFCLAFSHCSWQGIQIFVYLFGARADHPGAAGAVTDSWKGFFLPGILALVIALGVAYCVFRGILTFDMENILMITSVVLLFFAAGLTTRAFHELQEAQALGDFDDKTNVGSAWWNAKMWSIKSCCDSSDNEFFATLNSLLGFSDSPSFIHVISYMGYWIFVLPILLVLYWQKLCGARNKIAWYSRALAATSFVTFVIGFGYCVSRPTWTGFVLTSLGLVLSVVACCTVFDASSSIVEAIRSRRKPIVLASAVAFAVLTVLGSILPIIQMVCLKRSCRLPDFYYWGLILNQNWLATAGQATEHAFKAVAVLTLSTCVSIAFLGGLALLLYMFALGIAADGHYIYDDSHLIHAQGFMSHGRNEGSIDVAT
jgi:high-affinity iron transporter